RRLRAFYVSFDAVGTLGRESNSQCDELAILSRNGAVLAAHDVIQAEPGPEFRGREFRHFLEKSQIADIMVVFAHFSPPVLPVASGTICLSIPRVGARTPWNKMADMTLYVGDYATGIGRSAPCG